MQNNCRIGKHTIVLVYRRRDVAEIEWQTQSLTHMEDYKCSRHCFTYIRGWMQMVLAPNDLFSWNNKAMSTMLLRVFTRFLLVGYARQLTLCMIAFWSHEGVVFFPPSHLITSSRLPCLGSTDAHWPHLGAPVPSPPKWRPFPQGPRTLPY
jgi:hypothetical protein